MRKSIAAGLLSCLLATSAFAASSQRETWNQPTAPFQIIDNIYYVGTAGLSSWLITTPEGHVLLDGALEESADQIERNIRTLGFEPRDIKYLLNSHAHFDHSGGLARLKKATGAVLISSEADRSSLESGAYLGSEDVTAMNSVPVKVDRTIADGQSLTIGKLKLTANLTPGHTRGCTSWSMPVTDAGRTLKVLFYCSSSVAANRLVGPRPQYPEIVADYEKTFRKVKTMHVDVFLAPHPEQFGLREKRAKLGSGPNPFVDPAEFGKYVAASEADFRKQLAAQQERTRAAK